MSAADNKKLTQEQMNYYEQGTDNIKFTAEDSAKVEYDRLERIGVMAENDVRTRSEKRPRSSFNNDSEYKYYVLSVYSAAHRDFLGV